MTQEIVDIFSHYEKQGTVPWTYSIAARDLSYQVGSLTKALLQLEGARYNEGKTETELKAKVGDELADILAEVLFISHELSISLSDAWDDMLKSDYKKIAERTTLLS